MQQVADWLQKLGLGQRTAFLPRTTSLFHGTGVVRLADLPAEWSRQHRCLAFLGVKRDLSKVVRNARMVVATVTAFTVAHSITLALAALQLVRFPRRR